MVPQPDTKGPKMVLMSGGVVITGRLLQVFVAVGVLDGGLVMVFPTESVCMGPDVGVPEGKAVS